MSSIGSHICVVVMCCRGFLSFFASIEGAMISMDFFCVCKVCVVCWCGYSAPGCDGRDLQ